MASRDRFAGSAHQRDPRGALFEGYNGGAGASVRESRKETRGGYGFAGANSGGGAAGYNSTMATPGYGYGGGVNGNGNGNGSGSGGLGVGMEGSTAYRPATPNRRGQYSDAILNELESQNDTQVEGIMGKVRQLKDMTIAIGDEIRDSSALAEKMNDSFDLTRVRIRGTMNRMLVMAQKTGVGWRVWLGFFGAVGMLFWWVWVF